MQKSVLMCPPEHFAVDYQINPWMNPDHPVDAQEAVRQWATLKDAYQQMGVPVDLIEPIPGLPDMVYTANGGFTLDGKAYGAKFRYAERIDEGPAFMEWFEAHGYEVHQPQSVNEGEGDLLLVGDTVLAGHGFRTDLEAHDEVRQIFDVEVLSLRLVDPRFYHIDTCTTVLGDTIAYFPGAFDEEGKAELARRYPDAIQVEEEVAAVLGLNSFYTDGKIVLSPRAGAFQTQLEAAGIEVINVDLPELVLGGGSIKCCTLRLR